MFFMEYESTEEEVLLLVQEAVHDPINNKLREQIIDPMIKILETPKGRKEYIKYGNSFLEDNADMLSKEFPTKRVSFPRKYVDGVLELFGFDVKSLKSTLKGLFKDMNAVTDFKTILENPTNVIHTVVLFYSDMILNRELRDSARQQIGLSIYSSIFNKFFPHSLNESVMAYTYMNLNGSWGIVKSENMINWIGTTVETSYGFWKTKLTVDMSMNVLIQFLNRIRSSFNQNIQGIASRYYKDIEEKNSVGSDVDNNEEYLLTRNFSKYRNNLMRLIKGGDELYHSKKTLYPPVARLKNVKVDTLYEFAKKVEHKDISNIIDNIFYVFLVKEDNELEDINSTKFMSRITNLPTAIDRAIKGKPVIIPLVEKYETDGSIVKAYICLVAVYIMRRMNDVIK